MERICFLSDNYIDEMGGEQRVLTNIMNMLADTFKIDLYCKFRTVKKSYYPIDETINLIDIDTCPPIKSGDLLSRGMRWLNYRTAVLDFFHLTGVMKRIKFSEKLALAWIELLNKSNYKCVIGVSCFWGMFLMLYGNQIEAKSYSWFHNTYHAYFNSRKKYLYGYKGLLDSSSAQIDRLIVLTKKDQDCYCEKHRIPALAIPNPLSFESKDKADLKSKKLLFVGRLQIKQKGLDYLVSILELVFAQDSEWEIDIIGDGNDMSYLQQEVDNHHWNNRVHMLGNQSNVTEHYLNSSVLLLTSRWEGFGLVVTEAMECGVPVVSFATSGPSEIISDGVDGFLIEQYDIAAFAERILYLINNQEERFKMGKNAAKKANHYSKENIRKMWLDLLSKKGDF